MTHKRIVLIERLHHHDTLKTMGVHFSDAGYECECIVGEYVARRMDSGSEIIILPQTERKRWSDGRISQEGPRRRKVNNACVLRREIQGNIWQTFCHVRKKNYDYIYLNTTNKLFCRPMCLLFLLYRKKTIVMIHNTNMSLRGLPAYDILTNIFLRLFYSMVSMYVLLGEYIHIPYMVSSSRCIFITNRVIDDKSVSVPCVTGRVFVPGVIIPGRRNEKGIYDILEKITKTGSECDIMTGKRDGEISRELLKRGLSEKVKTHQGFISENKYKKLFMGAEVIVLVIDPQNKNYGTHQITGTFGDALAYGYKVMIPERYAPGYDFGSGVWRYDERCVDDVLEKCMNEVVDSKNTYKKKYSRERVAKRIKKLLQTSCYKQKKKI